MDDLLFHKADLRAVLEGHERKMYGQIDAIPENRLLNTSPDDLCNYFEQEYKVNPPVIDEGGIQVDHGEARVDVSHRFEYAAFPGEGPVRVTGTRVTFLIPLQGDRELLKFQPSTFNLNPPRGTVGETELSMTYMTVDHDAGRVKADFQNALSNLKSYLQWIQGDVAAFNSSLRQKAIRRIEARREKLLKDRGLVASLGFPLRRREDAPKTYVVPTQRRQIPRPMPAASEAPFVPEPTLDMEEYDYILDVISNMVLVMERSPHAFRDMGEEDLRQHFLVQLNGQYEGRATGETFNFEGKTDILIREQGRNIFIAECKFWKGPEEFRKAIDQLLGYMSWRDTKSALLVFNRERALSTVLGKIPEVANAHPNYKREEQFKSETGFRYIFGHRDDPNRELIVTVLVFEVPA